MDTGNDNDIGTSVGFQPIFSCEEEKLVEHISYMADIGYGYNVSSIKYMARDYGIHCGNSLKSRLSDCFMTLPNLKI